jgi:hypothetical protein
MIFEAPGGAVFSACGTYRYALWRTWDANLPAVLFIGLNPSTADAVHDDPTIRRCLGYARAWGCGSLRVANLFALRTPHPEQLWQAADPIGPENDDWLAALSADAGLIVACWGNLGAQRQRAAQVQTRLPELACLGVTRQSQPAHPLYLRKDLQPQLYKTVPALHIPTQ